MLGSNFKEVIFFIIICSSLLILLITFITLLCLRFKKKQKMHGEKMEEIKLEHITELVNSRMEIQEQTLDKVSREIHDNIGQKLTLAKLNLNVLLSPERKFDPALHKTSVLIGCVIAELRDLSHSMNSEVMLINGLINALENEAVHLRKSGLFEVDIIVEGKVCALDAKTELLMFRITQEAVNNIIKHAEAKRIIFKLKYSPEHIILSIIDDGRGFRLDEIKKGGMGMFNMEKRCLIMGATYTIESDKGKGTSINLKMPNNEVSKEMQSNVG